MNSSSLRAVLPGVILSIVIAYTSVWLSGFHKLLDPFALAIFMGIIIGSMYSKKNSLWMGTALCKDILLPAGLILYGAKVNFTKIAALEGDVFVNASVCLVVGFTVIYLLCKRLGVSGKAGLLTSTGSVVCGVSAIAVGTSMLDAKEEDTTRAIIAILVVGLAMLFTSVFFLSGLFGGMTKKFALFCGLTINQTGLIKIAGSYMDTALSKYALTVKYLRTSCVVPMGFVMMALSQMGRNVNPEVKKSAIKYGVTLAVLFFGASMLCTFTPISQYGDTIKFFYKILWSMALASIGLTCDVKRVLTKETVLVTISALIGWLVVVALYLGVLRSL